MHWRQSYLDPDPEYILKVLDGRSVTTLPAPPPLNRFGFWLTRGNRWGTKHPIRILLRSHSTLQNFWLTCDIPMTHNHEGRHQSSTGWTQQSHRWSRISVWLALCQWIGRTRTLSAWCCSKWITACSTWWTLLHTTDFTREHPGDVLHPPLQPWGVPPPVSSRSRLPATFAFGLCWRECALSILWRHRTTSGMAKTKRSGKTTTKATTRQAVLVRRESDSAIATALQSVLQCS